MSNIVANMGDDGDEKRDKDKQLIDEINEKADNIEGEPVSYTHLTLPTILLV